MALVKYIKYIFLFPKLFKRIIKDLVHIKLIERLRNNNPDAIISSGIIILGNNVNGIHIGEKSIIEKGVIFDMKAGGEIILGKNVRIRSGAILSPYNGFIRIGDFSGVNHYSILYGHGGLTIGDFVRIAPQCMIVPSNHNFSDKTKPIYYQSNSNKGITLGDNIWIGANCVVLDGVNIDDGVVIAAGAVVTKSFDADLIIGGVPAKIIDSR